MANPNDNEFDLDSFLNDDVETFSRSTTNSIEDIGVFDEKEVVFGIPEELLELLGGDEKSESK
tara:strand:- start:111 stop:299 length:189 start_codon:yes stop_codon:yes gene_type:complete